MRFRYGFAGALVLGFCFGSVVRAADGTKPADPYADDPYWYKPGHAVAPADGTAIKVAEGFAIERVLTVPSELGSWTAVCVDPQGRLIAAAQQRPGLFRVTLPPADSTAQASVEQLEGVAAEIGWSHGLLYAFDSLYVTVSEMNDALDRGVYRLMDTDGDGQFDRSTLLFKLDGAGEHGPHNLVVTPDGNSLLLMCGNGTRVPADLTDRRPAATTGIDHLMPPGFESSKYSTQGWVMRFDPDGSKREVILTGLRNSFDLAFDSTGELFTFDSDAEWDLGTAWYRPTRIAHLVTGGEYGWRDDAAVWPEYFEDNVPPVLNVGPGSPSGLVFGYGAKFPERYQRALFICDWTFATVYAVFLDPHGASHTGRIQEFVGGAGLPLTDVVIGKDGAMYLVVGGRRLGSAIYRVRYVGEEQTDPIVVTSVSSDAVMRRRALEALSGRKDPAAVVQSAWKDLGSPDRALRFAARVALEKQPVNAWRHKALQENDADIALPGLLALARQGSPEDQFDVVRRCSALPWQTFSAEQKLRGLRVYELALARGGDAVRQQRDAFGPLFAAKFPDADSRVTRELSRLRCALGDETIIDDALAVMASDTGETQAMGAAYFQRNPKYGQAVREMLEAAPMVERMHHAQMLLWLANLWTPEQRRIYFQILADATAYSKGGHRYTDFWNRIREAALERMPESERPALMAIGATSELAAADETTLPRGPGREWTIDTAADAVRGGLVGRDFSNGKAMYSATGCAACHRFAGAGGTIGPDLSGVGQRFGLRDILEAVIEPSRVISDQYKMMMLKTRDGGAYSGRILSRDSEFTRIAPNLMRPSQTVSVARDAIISEEALPVSIMPSGLVDTLNPDELRDLLAYLMSGAEPQHPMFKQTR